MSSSVQQTNGYDIIGDIHGHADALKALLQSMDYRETGGAWRHPERTAVFVGDFIDRGPKQIETVDIVRRMIDAGSARAVMGNHEFNAIAWFLEDPENPGRHLRPHTDKNFKQHERFLAEVIGTPLHRELVDWFMSLPLWLELDGIRIVHACWHDPLIDYLRTRLTKGNVLTMELVAEASRKPQASEGARPDAPNMHNAIEIILKGLEIKLPDGHVFHDKDGHERRHVRTKWWNPDAATYKATALNLTEQQRAELPDTPIPDHARFWKGEGYPVLVGHYWFSGRPEVETDKVAVLDYSIARGGKLVAYRWNGETSLDEELLHWVG